LCPRCFTALQESEGLGGLPAEGGEITQVAQGAWFRPTAGAAWLILKALAFLALFAWAGHGSVGAGALRGAVAADAFTWLVFACLEWPAHPGHVSAGGIFQFVLIVFYFERDALFDIHASAESLGMSMLLFFMVLFFKTAAWCTRRALGVSGAAERGSR